ncbi:MAG TPA: trigger factor [Usitatibacter sp.]|jgi:trigger factor|nr:trigger factor [Usitatibacter sp.]
MQQAVQNTPSPLERNITVSVPIEQIEAEIATRLKKLARTVRMQGFRPGKVPLKMVERQYGFQVRQEVVTDSVFKRFDEAVKGQNYRVAGNPRFQPVNAPEGAQPQAMEYTATFEVYPEVSLGDVSSRAIKRPVTDIGEGDVEKTLETLRKQRAKYENVDRAAATGDLVNIDFEGLIAGEAFQGNKASNFTVVLGEGRMLPDFEAALTGMKQGEQKTFPITFPQDYDESVKGKTADFTVTVNQVAEPKLPPLDAEFARQLGVETGEVDRLKKEVRENIEKEVAKRVKASVKEQVMDALHDSATFEVPRALLDGEIQRMQQQAVEDLKQRGMTTQDLTLPPDLFMDRAKRRIKVGLLVAELVKKNQLHARPEQVRKTIDEHSQSFEKPEELVRWYYADPSRLAEVEALVMEDNVVEWAMGNMKVADEKTPFDDLMAPRKG